MIQTISAILIIGWSVVAIAIINYLFEQWIEANRQAKKRNISISKYLISEGVEYALAP